MESTVFIGVGATIGMSLVGALLWVGRLQQRLTVLEERDREVTKKTASLEERAASSDVSKALFEQKVNGLVIDVNILRADLANVISSTQEIRLQQTETRSDLKNVVEAMNQLRDSMVRWEREMRRLVSAALNVRADDDTPPTGLPRTSREP